MNKQFFATLSSLLALFVCGYTASAQNTGIGIGTATPHPSAAFEVADSSRGILIPRMTMAQRNAIQNPAEGLMVYQTDSTKGFWYWGGSNWINISAVISSGTVGSDAKTLIYTITGF